MHKGSKETMDFIGQWVESPFPFSRNDGWGRMGFLGALSDMVVACTPGAMVEIGVGESSIYLSRTARKYGCNIYHCDVAPDKILNPLTVPGYLLDDAASDQDLLEIQQGFTQGIRLWQHERSSFYMGPSDDFFNVCLREDPNILAFSFIDGDHNYVQAYRDFWNCFRRTMANGFICLHDTYPPNADYLSEHRCGDVYKLRLELQQDPRVDVLTFPRGTAMDVGLTVVRKRPMSGEIYHG